MRMTYSCRWSRATETDIRNNYVWVIWRGDWKCFIGRELSDLLGICTNEMFSENTIYPCFRARLGAQRHVYGSVTVRLVEKQQVLSANGNNNDQRSRCSPTCLRENIRGLRRRHSTSALDYFARFLPSQTSENLPEWMHPLQSRGSGSLLTALMPLAYTSRTTSL